MSAFFFYHFHFWFVKVFFCTAARGVEFKSVYMCELTNITRISPTAYIVKGLLLLDPSMDK